MAALSRLLQRASLPAPSFEDDVLPLSQYRAGGSVTERHMLYACARKLIAHYGKGPPLLRILRQKLGLAPDARTARYLRDEQNPHYGYDVLGVLKSSLLDRVYIPPTANECPPVKQVVAFARSIEAIPAYPYLGDVTHSVTGDKKAEKFEDDFLDELFDCVSDLGFLACAYMPPRNTAHQLARVSALCKRHGFMEISGVDINSSRQEFLYRNPPEYRHLTDSAWALVAHETMVQSNRTRGLFNSDSPWAHMGLAQRIARYADMAKSRRYDIV